jgi:multidrug efflux pump subunit AcrA (membrane-fusion protein)
MINWRAMSIRGRYFITTALAAVAVSSCDGRQTAPAATNTSATAPGPVTIDTARVVEQPLSVQLSLPGELTAHQSVAIYARVTAFVKTLTVDRGSRVRAGALLAILEAPELAAQRAEAQSKLQAAEAQLSVVRARAAADEGTFEKLKAASATPGVVAGNDVSIAEKAAEAGRSQVIAAQQSVEAARQALAAIRDMEAYLRLTAPFAGVVTERNVHPGALVGPSSGSAASVPLLRIVENSRPRLVVPVPEAYTAEMISNRDSVLGLGVPGREFLRPHRAHCAVRRRQHENDGGRIGCDEHGWPTGARHLLSGALARPAAGTVAVRAECECRRDDRSHVCDSAA